MGTRGLMGFRLNGIDHLSYNHYDSYPSELGQNLLSELQDNEIDLLKDLASKVKIINPNSKPNQEDIEKLKQYTNLKVSNNNTFDWYCLTRELQGQFYLTLKTGYWLSNNKFIYNSLQCEWAYIVNFDDNVFEVYKGFQGRHNNGRFADKVLKNCDYYPCALIATFDFNNLPANLNNYLNNTSGEN